MGLPVRTNPRASRYDYTFSGVYFVTICTRDREKYFGKITDKKMILNEIGRICEEELKIMLQKRPSVNLHEYTIMPNHIHLLLKVDEMENSDNINVVPTSHNTITHTPHHIVGTGFILSEQHNHEQNTIANISHQSLGSIIGTRKVGVSRTCHEKWYSFSRQSRYHDHIVRNEQEYNNIRHYIRINPAKREDDQFRIEI